MAAASCEAEPSQRLAPAPAPLPPAQPERKKLHRAPSPARPKDVPGWSLAKSRRGSHPGSPVFFPGKSGAGGGHSRRSGSAKDGRGEKKGKATPPMGSRGSGKGSGGRVGARVKGRSRLPGAGEGAAASGGAGKMPSARSQPPPALSLTDSSSEVSDCSASEEAKLLSLLELGGLSGGGSDFESPPSSSAPAQPASASADGVSPLPEDLSTGASLASSRLPLSTSLAFSDLTEELLDAGVARELEELRSENDYLKVSGVRFEGRLGGERAGTRLFSQGKNKSFDFAQRRFCRELSLRSPPSPGLFVAQAFCSRSDLGSLCKRGTPLPSKDAPWIESKIGLPLIYIVMWNNNLYNDFS